MLAQQARCYLESIMPQQRRYRKARAGQNQSPLDQGWRMLGMVNRPCLRPGLAVPGGLHALRCSHALREEGIEALQESIELGGSHCE